MYGSETWAMKVNDVCRLERTENNMVRGMCGVKLSDRHSSDELRERLRIASVMKVVRAGSLGWFGHLERMSVNDPVSACRHLEVPGERGKGRPGKTWQEGIDGYMRVLGLHRGLVFDRSRWKESCWGNRLTRVHMENGRYTK